MDMINMITFFMQINDNLLISCDLLSGSIEIHFTMASKACSSLLMFSSSYPNNSSSSSQLSPLYSSLSLFAIIVSKCSNM